MARHPACAQRGRAEHPGKPVPVASLPWRKAPAALPQAQHAPRQGEDEESQCHGGMMQARHAAAGVSANGRALPRGPQLSPFLQVWSPGRWVNPTQLLGWDAEARGSPAAWDSRPPPIPPRPRPRKTMKAPGPPSRGDRRARRQDHLRYGLQSLASRARPGESPLHIASPPPQRPRRWSRWVGGRVPWAGWRPRARKAHARQDCVRVQRRRRGTQRPKAAAAGREPIRAAPRSVHLLARPPRPAAE